MKRFLLGIALLLFSALHAEAAVDRVCNYTVGSTTTAQGFANCTEEVADLSTKAFAIATSASNTGNAITIVTSPAVTSLTNGQVALFNSPLTITGAATLKLDGTAAASLYQLDGTTALGSGDLVSGARYMVSYRSDTGRWLLMGTPGTGAAPSAVPYVTIGNTASLGTERALTAGNCITLTDGGANSTATLAVASCSSANLATGVTDETGSGALVFATSPTLVTPNLGTPSAATLTNATGLPITTGVSGLGTGVATFLGTPSSANLAAAVTDETGSGALVFATSPTFVTPALGTPSSGTLTNATGLPISTGVSGLGTGVATFLATPTSANLAAALTNETGSGAAVFGTSPSLTTPAIGSGGFTIAGSSSGTTTIVAAAAASGTITVPAATDTLVGKATTDTLSNKTISLASNTLTSTSAQLATALSDETGSGAAVFATSPSLTTPTIGSGGALFAGSTSGTTTVAASATASGTLTLPAATDTLVGKATTDTLTNKSISLGSNTLTTTSAQLATATSDETGSGALVFATSPTLVTPNLGTPSAATLTNATGLPISTGVSGLGTGVATALAVARNSNGGIPLQSGTPTSGNCVRWAVGGGIEDSGGTCGGGGGGGSPGGSSGQIQYNNGGAFGGFTASGDATINTGTGAVTIANDAVTYAKLQNVAANSVLANNTGSSGDVAEVALSASQLLGRGSSGNVSAITLGTGLSMSGTTLSASSGPTRIFKTANESVTSSTTFQDDDHLTFAVAASTNYAVRYVLLMSGAGTGGGLKVQLTGPASPTRVQLASLSIISSTVAGLSISAFSSSSLVFPSSTTSGYAVIEGIIQNGANSGNVTLQWAQNASSGTSSVFYAGSYLEYQVVQ